LGRDPPLLDRRDPSLGQRLVPAQPLHPGGEDLYQGEDYVVTLTEAHQVPAVATALQQVTEASMRRAYERLDPADYGPNWSEEDFEYTWGWFQEVRGLWSRAVTAGRAVIFTVDQ
jgi:Domain of unknown function (DUF1877)